MSIAIWISATSVLLTFFFGLATFLFNLKNNRRTDTNSLRDEIRDETRTSVMLEMINSTTQEIKAKIESINDRLIKVEESDKSAHKRIDELSNRLDGLEGK